MADHFNVPFTIRQMETFSAVAKYGSLSKAAEQLHVSVSTVSIALGTFENSLGEQLVVRKQARGTLLTSYGNYLLERINPILEDLKDLSTHDDGTSLSGSLTIGCFPTLAPSVLPQLLLQFLNLHPDVNIQLKELAQDDIEASLEAGEIDIALTYLMNLREGLHVTPLQRKTPHLLVPDDSRYLDRGAETSLRAFAQLPLVLLDLAPSRALVLELCRNAGFDPMISFRTPSFETARAFVGRGLGWSIVFQDSHSDESYEGIPVITTAFKEASNVKLEIGLVRRSPKFARVADAFVESSLSVRLATP